MGAEPERASFGDPADRGELLWWWEYARCRGRRRLFTEARSGPVGPARTICASCVCQNVCVWFALYLEPYNLRYHVYGGLSPAERQAFVDKHHVSPDWAKEEYAVERAKLWAWLVEHGHVTSG